MFRAICILFGFIAQTLVGQQPEISSLRAELNEGKPMQSAAAHGDGLEIDFTFSAVNHPELSKIEKTTSISDGPYLFLPRLGIVKGLFYPLDLGINIAKNKDLFQFSSYLQWTVFEAFRMPALALRTSFNRLSETFLGEVNSLASEAVISWGISYLSLYGGFGYAFNILTHPALPDEQTPPWLSRMDKIGLLLHFAPSNIIIAFETSASQGDSRGISSKIAFCF